MNTLLTTILLIPLIACVSWLVNWPVQNYDKATRYFGTWFSLFLCAQFFLAFRIEYQPLAIPFAIVAVVIFVMWLAELEVI